MEFNDIKVIFQVKRKFFSRNNLPGVFYAKNCTETLREIFKKHLQRNPILNIVAGSGVYYLAGLLCLVLINKKNIYEFYKFFKAVEQLLLL